jgi:predicted ester cyclase
MRVIENKNKVRDFYATVWNRHDKGAIPGLLHPEIVFRGSLGDEKHGHDGFTDYLDSVHAALDDYRCTIDDMLAEGDKVFAKMTFEGRHRAQLMNIEATGRWVSWAGAALFHFKGGMIAQLWVLGDLLSLKTQLADPDRRNTPTSS